MNIWKMNEKRWEDTNNLVWVYFLKKSVNSLWLCSSLDKQSMQLTKPFWFLNLLDEHEFIIFSMQRNGLWELA
jgi:hypothetical protein